MVERGEDFGFALETRESIGVRRDRRRQDFDRDLALEIRVGRAVHLAHATDAKKGDDLIRAEPRAGRERGGRQRAANTNANTTLRGLLLPGRAVFTETPVSGASEATEPTPESTPARRGEPGQGTRGRRPEEAAGVTVNWGAPDVAPQRPVDHRSRFLRFFKVGNSKRLTYAELIAADAGTV